MPHDTYFRSYLRHSLQALFAVLAFAGSARAAQDPEGISQHIQKDEVVTQRYMAVAANPLASRAAAEILKAGGSAADAAIAAQLVLTLVEPQSSGLGGGGVPVVLR